MTEEFALDCDLVVVGGGMAGLTAAAAASRRGAAVVVLEKTRRTGGTALGSGGYVWTLPSIDVARAQAFEGDPHLQEVIYDEFGALIDEMRAFGTHVEGPIDVLSGRGYHVDIIGYLGRCLRVIEANNGVVLRECQVRELLRDEDGRVRGVRVRQDGDEVPIGAQWVLLATGGFVADASLTEEFLGERSTTMRVRASRDNTGDGLKLARPLGAARALSRAFYGHMVGTGIALDDLEHMRAYGLYHSEHGILLGWDGSRFVDESLGDHMTVQAEYFATHESAVLIWDERINRDIVMQPWISGSPGEDRLAIAERAGARTGKPQSLDDLRDLLAVWGFDGDSSVRALRDFNEAMRSGISPSVERRNSRAPLAEPPYYVVEVSPAITFPYGGLKVDARAQVLDEVGRPVKRLLAAGSDVGGVMGPDYLGGLCTAGSFALRAVRNLDLKEVGDE